MGSKNKPKLVASQNLVEKDVASFENIQEEE